MGEASPLRKLHHQRLDHQSQLHNKHLRPQGRPGVEVHKQGRRGGHLRSRTWARQPHDLGRMAADRGFILKDGLSDAPFQHSCLLHGCCYIVLVESERQPRQSLLFLLKEILWICST